MICPSCRQNQSYCTDSRQWNENRKRTYKCKSCGAVYYTSEKVLYVRHKPDEKRQDQ